MGIWGDHSTAALQKDRTKQDVFRAVANLASREECGTLILDRLGRIRGCGAPAEKMFGTSQARMAGKRISEFIKGLHLGEGSPSYDARYLAYLSASSEWRRFEARDVLGLEFIVEVHLSRTAADGEEIFLLNVRRPEGTQCD